MSYTPGDWELMVSTQGMSVCSGPIHIATLTRSRVALHKMMGPEDMEANGQLIIAAPDLLKALKLLLEEATSAWPVGTWSQSIEQARAAIEKAEGKS